MQVDPKVNEEAEEATAKERQELIEDVISKSDEHLKDFLSIIANIVEEHRKTETTDDETTIN